MRRVGRKFRVLASLDGVFKRIYIAAILFRSRQKAERLRAHFADETEPIDVFAAATGLGCRVAPPQTISKTGVVEADLRPDTNRDRFDIRVDPIPRRGWRNTPESIRPALSRHRFRFRVCHELGHTFFYERGPGGPRRSRPIGASEEAWCDEFARSLLVPRRAAEGAAVDASSPFDLQAQFDVSLELAARAFVSAHRGVDAAVWFWARDAEINPSSLLQQWTNVPIPSLRPWREAGITAQAIAKGHATGKLPCLRRPGKRVHGSVRFDPKRRQLLVIAQR